MNKKIKIIIIAVTLVIVIGFTYAMFEWFSGSNTDVNFTLGEFTINYDGGTDITGVKLIPVTTLQKGLTDGTAIEKTITVSSSKTAYFNLYMDVEILDSGLKEETFVWEIYKGSELVNNGNFKNNNAGDTVTLMSEQKINATTSLYKLYIYLDGSVDNPETVENQDFRFVLHADATDKPEILPNAPKMTDGLIPVKYDGSKWVKADIDNNNNDWYNYREKKWANAVLVSGTNRSSYVNANVGTEIPENDVLAYYVWIPRYKYKVWNINKVMGIDSYDAENKGIDIVFENGIETTGTITCGTYSFAAPTANTTNEICSGSNGDYYTHPAFRFGNKDVEGIWVGKFEISSSNPNEDYGGGYVTNLNVRIKPNVPSWRYNPVSYFYTVIRNMQVSNNEYGLTTDSTVADSHMIKNIEWGALAYFTHSKYGVCSHNKCGEVYKNNSNSCITGNGGTDELSGSMSGITLAYNENKKIETVNGGTALNLSAPINDSTHPWTFSNGIWTSGVLDTIDSSSKLTYNFTNNSDAVMKLVFSVSSQFYNYFRLYLDGTEIMSATDVNRGTEESNLLYDTFLYEIPSGTHTLEASFTYRNSSATDGLNKAFIKSLEIFEGATINVTHTNELGGQMASTTHNESGIYDIVGGSHEHVMANMSSRNGSYSYYPRNAGTNFGYGTTTMKYIDRYAYSETNNLQKDFNRAILGDATGEVVKDELEGWNNDMLYLFYLTSAWIYRGGQHISTNTAGLFYSYMVSGSRSNPVTTRAIMVVY